MLPRAILVRVDFDATVHVVPALAATQPEVSTLLSDRVVAANHADRNVLIVRTPL